MRSGIVVINGKVALGPVKYGEAESAYKAKLREGKPCEVEIWASDSSKKAKIKAPVEPAKGEPVKEPAKGAKK